jgi:signal transduction histidine kinase
MEPRNDSWRLLVRRHESLDAVVTSARRRNLAVSFGILLVLGATVALLLVLLRRADRLRAQQTEFVAAISHELNTPVAALRSAGENLRDGIITDREKLARYGGTIVKEATRLGDLLGQVMEFAGMQARPGRTAAEPVDVAAVVDEAVAQCQWLIADTPIRIDVEVDPALPAVAGDAGALTRAVQNLVANAVRHGGAGNWVGVHAKRDGEGIAITVEDRGPGIAAGDAAHLFEPFYRGRNSAAVRGAGLGLTIVQQVARAHGGSVRIDRKRRGGGAAFTIHLPVTHG